MRETAQERNCVEDIDGYRLRVEQEGPRITVSLGYDHGRPTRASFIGLDKSHPAIFQALTGLMTAMEDDKRQQGAITH